MKRTDAEKRFIEATERAISGCYAKLIRRVAAYAELDQPKPDSRPDPLVNLDGKPARKRKRRRGAK